MTAYMLLTYVARIATAVYVTTTSVLSEFRCRLGAEDKGDTDKKCHDASAAEETWLENTSRCKGVATRRSLPSMRTHKQVNSSCILPPSFEGLSRSSRCECRP